MSQHPDPASEDWRPRHRDDSYGEYEQYDEPARRGCGPVGCLVALVALVAVVGIGYVAVSQGNAFLDKVLSSAPAADYKGPGHGSVTFEVHEGDTVSEIGRNLKAHGVIRSVDAFIDASRGEERASGIQVGFYPLKKEMKAADALEVLVDPDNLMVAAVTVPEGLRVADVVPLLADKTDFTEKQLRAALKNPAIGLPDYAEGNPEGYLFPATYQVGPKDKAVDLVTSMVDRWREEAERLGLEEKAAALGHTPAELMIVASLVEAEGRGEDMPKIARVIYNRLDGPGNKGGTNGTLGIDASNAYGLGKSGTTALSSEELAVDTPYDTRRRPGLPPTPIEAPGADAMAAAANPADGPWYYYVTVNLETGETKFYEDHDGFLRGKAEYLEYCETESDRC